MQSSMQVSTWQLVGRSLSMAWPIAAQRIIVAINNFLGMLLIAMQGHEALAAAGLIFPTVTSISVIIGAILFALSAIISRAFGANDMLKIGAIVQQGWVLSILLMMPSLLLLWYIKPVLLAFGQDPQLVQIVQQYFHAYILGVFPMFFNITNQQLAVGVGKQRLAMMSTLTSAMLGLMLAYGLGFGHFGLPNLGVSGIGIGMASQVWVSLIFLQFYFWRDPFFAQFKLYEWRIRESYGYLKQLFVLGWPIMLQVGGELLAWFLVTLFVGWLGVGALAAQQITGQYNMLAIIPVFGFAQASSVLIGQAAGAKRYDEVGRLGRINIGIGVAFILFVSIFFIGMPNLLASVYIDVNDPAFAYTLYLTKWIFIIFAIDLLFDSMRNITTGALRGLYDNRYPMLVGILLIWLVSIPLAYLFGFHFHWGVIGLNVGNAIGYIIGALILLWRWHTRYQSLIHRAEAADLKASRK